MKKILLLFAALFVLNSCDLGDDGERYHLEVLPVESFVIPEYFVMGQTYTIKLYYRRPTTCYGFDGIYYKRENNIRTIGVQNFVLERNDCEPISLERDPSMTSFNFLVTNNGSYVFKFYKGKDDDGNSVFEEVEIPVVEN